MDTCHYCGAQYHPMPVYTRPGARIHVCHHRFVIDDETGELGFQDTNCKEKAALEGYTYRPGLTPKR